ncbi:hypothetical protein HDU67_004545 [Dinochytrium kinnereticum]|nr:hypothetical protein HDU67_004545 [Dinochytrium kinnereticum]
MENNTLAVSVFSAVMGGAADVFGKVFEGRSEVVRGLECEEVEEVELKPVAPPGGPEGGGGKVRERGRGGEKSAVGAVPRSVSNVKGIRRGDRAR